jgi:2-keto-4-pentenoate hydratase/2-oxohepta-3-ene-1,7-dioic acid hydratase in catechol pathway
MGTDGASPDLKAGDVVEIEITGIGTLRNKFVAEQRQSVFERSGHRFA